MSFPTIRINCFLSILFLFLFLCIFPPPFPSLPFYDSIMKYDENNEVPNFSIELDKLSDNNVSLINY